MLGQCPGDMLTHQSRGMIRAAAQGGKYVVGSRGIAKGNCDITQPALRTNATDRSASGPVIKLNTIPSKDFDEGCGIKAACPRDLRSARQQVGEFGLPGVLVPGTDQLTVITAKDPIADR